MGKWTYNRANVGKFFYHTQNGEPDNTVIYISAISNRLYHLTNMYVEEHYNGNIDNKVEIRREHYDSKGILTNDKCAIIIHINAIDTFIADFRRAQNLAKELHQLFAGRKISFEKDLCKNHFEFLDTLTPRE